MNTIAFSIHGRFTNTTGEAIIVDSYKDGHNAVAYNFEGNFTTLKIGEYKEGVRHDADVYAIYENYQDSGSDDYSYFAIKL